MGDLSTTIQVKCFLFWAHILPACIVCMYEGTVQSSLRVRLAEWKCWQYKHAEGSGKGKKGKIKQKPKIKQVKALTVQQARQSVHQGSIFEDGLSEYGGHV